MNNHENALFALFVGDILCLEKESIHITRTYYKNLNDLLFEVAYNLCLNSTLNVA